MSKFLNLENKEDEKKWEAIIEIGHGADLHRCPYDQDFKESRACPKYEPSDDPDNPYDPEWSGECQFALITNSKCFCELQPKSKREFLLTYDITATNQIVVNASSAEDARAQADNIMDAICSDMREKDVTTVEHHYVSEEE